MSNYKLVAGLDIGNGYVKGEIEGNDISMIDIPSGVAYVTSLSDIKATGDDINDVVSDIYNQMDVSFNSELVSDNNRRLFGRRGVTSGMSLEEFDVYSHISKAKQNLSKILVLGCSAGKVLQDYWNQYHNLPQQVLHADIMIALALPIREYIKYRKEYASGFRHGTHIVTFHNFEQPVTVELTFKDVQVIAEGASAQYAITAKGEPLMNSMLADVRKMGNPLEGITASDVLAARNTIGVDIGEGTVNFPVFQSGKFNPDVSITFDKGYGSVMNRALDRLNDAQFPFNSRKELVDFLQVTPNNLTMRRYQQIQAIVSEEVQGFVNEVTMQFIKVLSRVGSAMEVVYVYGGGATPVKETLYPKLIEASKQFGGDAMFCPILYLDSRYSRNLNREGLFTVEKTVANNTMNK